MFVVITYIQSYIAQILAFGLFNCKILYILLYSLKVFNFFLYLVLVLFSTFEACLLVKQFFPNWYFLSIYFTIVLFIIPGSKIIITYLKFVFITQNLYQNYGVIIYYNWLHIYTQVVCKVVSRCIFYVNNLRIMNAFCHNLNCIANTSPFMFVKKPVSPLFVLELLLCFTEENYTCNHNTTKCHEISNDLLLKEFLVS